MTTLRAETIKAMQMHGFSPRTHESYLAAVKDLARYHHRSPHTLAVADLCGYLEHPGDIQIGLVDGDLLDKQERWFPAPP
jgi:hypothetical protein